MECLKEPTETWETNKRLSSLVFSSAMTAYFELTCFPETSIRTEQHIHTVWMHWEQSAEA